MSGYPTRTIENCDPASRTATSTIPVTVDTFDMQAVDEGLDLGGTLGPRSARKDNSRELPLLGPSV